MPDIRVDFAMQALYSYKWSLDKEWALVQKCLIAAGHVLQGLLYVLVRFDLRL